MWIAPSRAAAERIDAASTVDSDHFAGASVIRCRAV